MKLFLFNNDEKLIGTVSPLEGIQNEEINKIQTIECTVVYSELIEKASYIGHKDYSDNRIFHLYKIDHITKTSTTDIKIVGVHTFFDDMESDGYVKDFRPTNRELVGVLTTILDGSRWLLGTVNIQRRYTGNFYYVTRKEALSKLIEATQIEIKPRLEFSRGKITGRYLDVFTRLGGRNGKVFVHGRDLLTVSEKKSQGAIYTAVVGRGKGEETDTGGYGRRITFKDVEWRRTSGQPVDKPVGQEYVEIPAMTKLYGFEKGTKPRIKIVEFQDETDKEKLLRLSYEWLEKNSRMQVEYSAKVLNVGNLELGDTVGIFNPKLGIKYETRVFKVKRNLVDNKLTEFGIGDKVTTSPFSRTIELAKEMKNFQDDTVYWLDKIRERLSDKLINEDGYNYDLKADNEYKIPAGYYSFDKPIDQNPTKVVYMGAGKIAIANSKKPTGEWNWKTFLDGTGATLDLINTGVLKAGRIQSADGRSYWDLDTGEFHMEQSAINEAVKTAVNGKVQEIVGEVKKNLPTKEELKGKSSYIHKKYSDFSDGRNMSDNSTLKYIGIYTGDKEQAPTNASEYSWTKIRGEDGERGRDGVDGKSYARNYLSGTADEKVLLAINDDFDIQEAFKLVDNKNFRDLGFKNGDKITFIADYEVLPNGSNKKISKLNFEWHDDNQYRVWMEQDINPTKGTYVRTLTMNNDLLDCKRARFRADNVNAKIKITNARVIQGDTVQPWSIAQEDLQGHSLTANLRFEGKYINSVVTNLNTFVDVFYDGQKITEGFELKAKHKGTGTTNWTDFISRPYDNTGRLTNFIFSNGEKDGTPLEVIVLVTYKGLNTIASERLENVPDVTEIKETVKKYKTFESTLDRFNSTIGQVKEQVVNGNRNYISNSGSLNDKRFDSWGKWDKHIQNGTVVLTKVGGSDTTGFWFSLADFLKTEFQNETMTWSIDVRASRNCTFNHIGFETNGQRSFNLTTQWQRISHTFINKFTNYFAFTFYNPNITFNNGDKIYIRFPKLEKGNVATEWTVAPEDVSLLKETTETSIEQTNRNLELKVSKGNVIASINASVEKDENGENRGLVKIKGDVISDYLYGKTIEGATIKGGSKIQIGEHGYMMPSGDGLRFCLPEKPKAKNGVGVQMLGNYGRDGNSAYGLYIYVDPNFDTREVASTNSYLMTVNGYILSKGINNLRFQNYADGSTSIGAWDKDVSLLFDRTDNDIFYQWKSKYSLWNIVNNYYNSTSDIRLKKDIKKCDYKALDLIDDFKFKSFNWKYHEEFGQKPYTEIGLIAQDVEKINKNFVAMAGEYKTLNQFNLLTYSLKAIQELSAENTNLKLQLKEMNERLQKLEDKINGKL